MLISSGEAQTMCRDQGILSTIQEIKTLPQKQIVRLKNPREERKEKED